VRTLFAAQPTTGMMAVVGGKVLMTHGSVTTLSYLASVRKSVLAMLLGNYVEQGKVNLDRTLAELGMDDVQGLTPLEKQATIRNLFTARSGIYHPASNSGDDTQFAPPRGSQQPGTFMLYNNWDFNAAGAAFEKETGRNIYDALERSGRSLRALDREPGSARRIQRQRWPAAQLDDVQQHGGDGGRSAGAAAGLDGGSAAHFQPGAAVVPERVAPREQ
jgi:hypothetical protein